MTRAKDVPTAYPVGFDIERPPKFRREQVFLRIGLLVVVGWIGHPVGLLWLGVPLVAAVLISQKGGQRYIEEDGPKAVRVLNWLLDAIAYLALLTDKLPGESGRAVRFEVRRSGSPTVSSALWRILYAIPSLIVLSILTFFGAIAWILAAILVVKNETYPENIWQFLCGIARWQARLVAYLASLVDAYPPFTLGATPAPAAAGSSPPA